MWSKKCPQAPEGPKNPPPLPDLAGDKSLWAPTAGAHHQEALGEPCSASGFQAGSLRHARGPPSHRIPGALTRQSHCIQEGPHRPASIQPSRRRSRRHQGGTGLTSPGRAAQQPCAARSQNARGPGLQGSGGCSPIRPLNGPLSSAPPQPAPAGTQEPTPERLQQHAAARPSRACHSPVGPTPAEPSSESPADGVSGSRNFGTGKGTVPTSKSPGWEERY
ncbi:hypothetical protein NDU88_002209 [Pleurodeles waltl]|uniref:Uncharacterized protein n=1 Tax=Pleurodeles waltl TaxID=8319 RepID=A0AAV7LBQ1_PLEWA|nr:hypothetical protein NDU88_002209 [Pleurodeles waltl]